MDMFQIKKKSNILIISLFIFSTFLLTSLIGLLDTININIENIIDNRPLSGSYFLFYLVFGIIIPIIIRFYSKDRAILRSIDTYMLLIYSQIFTEIVLVILVGKGIGVLIGFTFSMLRLIQVFDILNSNNFNLYFELYMKFIFIIWLINILQITMNRLIFML